MASLSEGPRGIEVPHVWVPGSGAAQITMNLLSARPRIRFMRMPGFASLPEADDNRAPRTARPGEKTYPSLARGKTWTVEGVIQATSLNEARTMDSQMRAAFGERDHLGQWHATPIGDAAYWTCDARVMQYEPDTDFTRPRTHPRGPWQIPFILGMRMSDPRFYWTTEQVLSSSVSVVATNLGNAPTDPIITVAGASGNVVVANTTTGKLLSFVDLPSGSLVLNFWDRTASIGLADASPYLDTYSSDWWDRGQPGIRPGGNALNQTGGSSIEVKFFHAHW